MPARVCGAARMRAPRNAPMWSARWTRSYASAKQLGATARLLPTRLSGISPRTVNRLPPDMPRAAARHGASHQRQLAPHS
jgi:hypothetical protein